MKHTARKHVACALLALMLLVLCGCQAISDLKQDLSARQEKMNDLLVKFMECVENNDAQGAAALAYDPQELLAGFPSIASDWPVHASDPFEPAGLSVNKTIDPDAGPRTFTNAVYIIHCQDQDYQAQFSVCEDSAGSGFIGFDVKTVQSLIDNGIEPAGTNTPPAKKSLGQWCFTAFWALCCIFCLVTIIDIVRKKPKLWGLWILIALFFFGFYFDKGPSSINTGVRFGLLNSSEWTRYVSGANHYQLCFPLGAILYWIMRRRLLKRKEAPTYAVPVQPVPPQPVPPQPVPPQPAAVQPAIPEPSVPENPVSEDASDQPE